MKTAALVLASMAAMSSAQATVNSDGTYSCSVPNAAYCSGTTLDTNIIIQCVDGTGHVESCDDSLSDSPPLGVSYSPCWQSDPKAGDAACSKNGTVYPASGSAAIWNSTAPFPVPGSSANDDATSSTTALPTITLTTTRTKSHTTTLTTHTTVTTYVKNSGTSTGGFWTTYIKEASAPTATVTAGSDTDSESTVFTTVGVTVETTICPESSTLSSASPTSVADPITISLAVARFVRPSGPVFSVGLNTTTINVGPGPVSISTLLPVSNGTAIAAPGNASPTGYVAYLPTTLRTSAGVAAITPNSTFVSPSATASPLTFTGATAKNVNVNGMFAVVFALLTVAWL